MKDCDTSAVLLAAAHDMHAAVKLGGSAAGLLLIGGSRSRAGVHLQSLEHVHLVACAPGKHGSLH
jgi:hypothetical protein